MVDYKSNELPPNVEVLHLPLCSLPTSNETEGFSLIPLTRGRLAIVDSEDFEQLSKHKWYAQKCKNSFYALRNTKGSPTRTKEYMHRKIINAQEGQEIDHRNGNGLDNRRCNLRDCTRSQNNQNRHKTKGTSQYKGVSWYKNGNKWRTEIMLNLKRYHLGYFNSEIEAAKSYDKKAKELFGEFALLNFPTRENLVGSEDVGVSFGTGASHVGIEIIILGQ